MKVEIGTMALTIIALAAAMLSSVVVPIPHASAVHQFAPGCDKSNPNCFVPPLCNNPATCGVFTPGLPGKK